MFAKTACQIVVLVMDANGSGEVGLGLVRHGVFDEVEEAVGRVRHVVLVVTLPAAVHEVGQLDLLVNLRH